MFHVRDGWYFERVSDGSVHIVVRKSANADAGLLAEFTIISSEWASVLATVSAAGEKDESYQAALAFHQHKGEHVVD